MKQLADMLTTVFSRDPTPSAPKTRLVTNSTIPPRTLGGINIMSRMTRETLKQIINSVNMDPLAGMGSFSKEDILIDRLLAHWNTVESRPVDQPTTPKPIVTEPAKPITLTGGVKPAMTGAAAAASGVKVG